MKYIFAKTRFIDHNIYIDRFLILFHFLIQYIFTILLDSIKYINTCNIARSRKFTIILLYLINYKFLKQISNIKSIYKLYLMYI